MATTGVPRYVVGRAGRPARRPWPASTVVDADAGRAGGGAAAPATGDPSWTRTAGARVLDDVRRLGGGQPGGDGHHQRPAAGAPPYQAAKASGPLPSITATRSPGAHAVRAAKAWAMALARPVELAEGHAAVAARRAPPARGRAGGDALARPRGASACIGRSVSTGAARPDAVSA